MATRKVKRVGQRKRQGFEKDLPVYLPRATEFTNDPVMNNPDWVMRTLGALEQSGELPKGLFDDADFHAGEGRPRMKGNFLKVACSYVASKKVGMEGFWNDYASNTLWQEAGFEADASRDPNAPHRPSYPSFYRRMTELEVDEVIDRFEQAADDLIKTARKHLPAIGRDVGIDATSYQTPNRLYHACKPGECGRDGRKGKRTETPTIVDGISAQEIEDARHAEARDEPAPTLADEIAERKARRTWIKEDELGRPWRFRKIGGCTYKCLDVDAGARSYASGKAWTGGYDLAAVDLATGGTLATVMFSASRREHAGMPALVRRLERTLDGDLPETMAADRGFSINKTYRFLTRRGVTLVAPWRKPNGIVNKRWMERREEYDEYGMARCPHCGGPTIQHGPGLGLSFRRGEPFIAFRCMLGITADCQTKVSTIRCEQNWHMLIGLSRDSERYFAVRNAEKNL